jgi:hypothetical protein
MRISRLKRILESLAATHHAQVNASMALTKARDAARRKVLEKRAIANQERFGNLWSEAMGLLKDADGRTTSRRR